MKYEFLSKVSYLIFSEDTTYLKAKKQSNFTIFSPITAIETSLPFDFKFHLTMGLFVPKVEFKKLMIVFSGPDEEFIDELDLGKMLSEKLEGINDDQVYTGNFSIYTEEGFLVSRPGILTATVLYESTPLAEAFVAIREVDKE